MFWNSCLALSNSSWDFENVSILDWIWSRLVWSSVISFVVLSSLYASDCIFVWIVFWCSDFIFSCWRFDLSVS